MIKDKTGLMNDQILECSHADYVVLTAQGRYYYVCLYMCVTE